MLSERVWVGCDSENDPCLTLDCSYTAWELLRCVAFRRQNKDTTILCRGGRVVVLFARFVLSRHGKRSGENDVAEVCIDEIEAYENETRTVYMISRSRFDSQCARMV